MFVSAALLGVALSSGILAAEATAKADKEKQFDQEAVLMESWKGPDDAVVGTVNGMSVTKYELLKTLWFWQAPTILQQILDQKMIQQAASDSGVDLTWAELQDKVRETLARMNAQDLNQFLNQYRVTKQRFMSGTKLQALAEKVIEKEMVIPDSDYAEWIQARHILIRFPQDEKDKDKKEQIAKDKIDEIAAKLKAGEDFAKLADEYSEDPGNSPKKGGDLGWFSKGRWVKEFDDVAFVLESGVVSEPVKTFHGYHLIMVDKRGKDASPAEKAELKQMIMEKKVPMELGRWFSEVQSRAKVDNKLSGPPVEQPKPMMGPQPGPNTGPAMTRPTPRPVKPPTKPGEPPASAKPDAPPPPPPPAQE
ncbi:MAG: hypothetical protein A2Z18_00430 [Armatimonadetes bacterium RBG_16_58_9]|nr:MAG: hypothetical protein A2Z18_00430 [Armatimonadetes bacterium RBG_16_58_9]